eukprot:5463622-Lingulodinium_polyedra.AAC.1
MVTKLIRPRPLPMEEAMKKGLMQAGEDQWQAAVYEASVRLEESGSSLAVMGPEAMGQQEA